MSCGHDLLPDGVLLFKLSLFVDLVSESIAMRQWEQLYMVWRHIFSNLYSYGFFNSGANITICYYVVHAIFLSCVGISYIFFCKQ